MKTAAEVVRAAFDAINLEDWGGLAMLCDPVSLRLFKDDILAQATATSGRFGESPDELLEIDCDESDHDFDAVLIDPEDRLARELFDVTTLEQLQEMDPGRVFARWIQAKSRCQRRILEEPEESWRGAGSTPSLRTAQVYRFVVLGCLNDGADLAHVLYRNDRDIPGRAIAAGTKDKSDAEEEDELQRILCVRSYPVTALCRRQADNSWKLIASRDLYLVPTVEVIDAS